MLYHSYKFFIDNGVGSPGHGKYVVDGLKATDFFNYNIDDNYETYWCSHYQLTYGHAYQNE